MITLEQAFSAGKRDGRLGYDDNNGDEQFDCGESKLCKGVLWKEYKRGYDLGCEMSCLEVA